MWVKIGYEKIGEIRSAMLLRIIIVNNLASHKHLNKVYLVKLTKTIWALGLIYVKKSSSG